METLTLEHLSAYLPYGLNILRPDNKTILKCKGINGNLYVFEEKDGIERFGSIVSKHNKPILYPLSSLTETIWYEGKEINPIEFIKDWYNSQPDSFIKELKFINSEENFTLFGLEEDDSYEVAMPYQAYQLLFKMKIDVFSLIEKGLAVDVNTLETNPYKS
jgi:hypothetical protein